MAEKCYISAPLVHVSSARTAYTAVKVEIPGGLRLEKSNSYTVLIDAMSWVQIKQEMSIQRLFHVK